MPIYEYACGKCGHEFEVEQRISDPPARTCPSCRSRKAKRLISRTSFVLKGGGWYSDLYSSGKPAGKDKTADKKSPPDDKGSGKSGSEAGSGDSSGGKPAPTSKPASSGDKSPKAAA